MTHDGNNYAFSSTDQPGIIYLPAGAAVVPVPGLGPQPQPEPRLDAWFGLGARPGPNSSWSVSKPSQDGCFPWMMRGKEWF